MSSLFLFLQSLFGSWMAWAGGIIRLIPFMENLIEPTLRRIGWIDRFLTKHGSGLKKNLKFIAAVCLFIGCYRAWVFEHKNAETAMYGKEGKSEAWSKYNQCDKERTIKSILADTYSSQISDQRSRLDGEQETFNRCILALSGKYAPEPMRIEVMRWQIPVTYTYQNVGKVQFWILVGVTNKVINAARGTLKCDAPFTSITSNLLTHGNSMRMDYGQVDERSVHVEFAYPPWSSQNPLVFAAYTPEGKNISSCSFKLD
jgi:hypothetical protein